MKEMYDHSYRKQIDEQVTEVTKHNVKLLNEYKDGEDGVDAISEAEMAKDPRMPKINKIKADLRA